MFISAVGISGVENVYAIGSSASVTCFSNLTVLTMQWVDTLQNNIMISMGVSHELILTVMNISRELHGTVFTCEVINKLPNRKNVTSRNNFILNSQETSELCDS